MDAGCYSVLQQGIINLGYFCGYKFFTLKYLWKFTVLKKSGYFHFLNSKKFPPHQNSFMNVIYQHDIANLYYYRNETNIGYIKSDCTGLILFLQNFNVFFQIYLFVGFILRTFQVQQLHPNQCPFPKDYNIFPFSLCFSLFLPCFYFILLFF